MLTLSDFHAVIVPSTIRINKPAPPELIARVVKAIETIASKTFGGCTTLAGRGSWFSNDENSLIPDNVTIVVYFHGKNDNKKARALTIAFARAIKTIFTQECVSIISNDGLTLV